MKSAINPKLIILLFVLLYFASLQPNAFCRDKIEWTFEGKASFTGYPAFDKSGTLYVAGSDGTLFAISRTGSLVWSKALRNGRSTSPAVSPSGIVYIGVETTIFALDKRGKIVWRFEVQEPIVEDVTVATDGALFVATEGGKVYALNPNGQLRWLLHTGGKVVSNVVIDSVGLLVVAIDNEVSRETEVVAFNPDRTIRWRAGLGREEWCRLVSGTNGEIYVTTSSGRFLGFRDFGQKAYDVRVSYYSSLSPVSVDSAGRVFFTDSSGYLYSYSSSGKFRWRAYVDSLVTHQPIVSGNGYVLVFDMYGTVHSFDEDGTKLRRWNTATKEPMTLKLDEFETLYLIGKRGRISVLQLTGPVGKGSGWTNTNGDAGNRKNAIFLGKTQQLLFNPYPFNNETSSNVLGLSWNINFPEEIAASYEVYFGKVLNPPLYATVNSAYIELNDLEPDTTYYWRIIARGTQGRVYEGPLWSFRVSAAGTKKWSFKTEDFIWSSPCVGFDGTVYVGSNDGYLYAITSYGTLKWRFKTANSVTASPMVGVDGTIYVGSEDGNFYAVDRDGRLKWKFNSGGKITSNAAISYDGTIFFGNETGNLYALRPNGEVKWSRRLGGGIRYGGIAVSRSGTIYVGCEDNCLYAIDQSGWIVWSFCTSGVIHCTPAIDEEENVYFCSKDGRVYSVNKEGKLRWSYRSYFSSSYTNASPVVDSDGLVYIGDFYNDFDAINASTGTLSWTYRTGGSVRSTAAIGDDGVIYVGSSDGALYAFSKYGSRIWTLRSDSGDGFGSSPTIFNRTLYVGNWDGALYAVLVSSTHLAKSPWPSFLGTPITLRYELIEKY